MTADDDLPDDMTEIPLSAADDDAAVDSWLAGGSVPDGFEPVAEMLAGLAASADQYRPTPNAALARILDAGAADAALPGPRLVDLTDERSRRGRRAGTAAALAIAIALTSVGAAAAAGGLPPAAQNALSRVVRGLTPFSLPTAPARGPAHPAAQLPAEPTSPPAVPAADSSGPHASLQAPAQVGHPAGATDPGHHRAQSSSDTGDDSARGQTAPPVQSAPDSSGSAPDSAAPAPAEPEPADSPPTADSTASPDPAVSAATSPSPSDETALPLTQQTGAPDGPDAIPAN